MFLVKVNITNKQYLIMQSKSKFSILLLFLTFQFALVHAAPDANQIITNILTSVQTNPIRTGFRLVVAEKNNSTKQGTVGVFTLKGSKFMLELDEMKVWFDGKTQWSYLAKNNEVTITNPTEKELAETNPMAILSTYKNKSDIRFASLKSSAFYVIELTPKLKNRDILKIDIQVNKTTMNLFSIKIIYKNGTTNLLTLTNYQKGIKVSDNYFVFNISKYKGVNENDLR
jgi:outer membrane lipoprotein-sorting protein